MTVRLNSPWGPLDFQMLSDDYAAFFRSLYANESTGWEPFGGGWDAYAPMLEQAGLAGAVEMLQQYYSGWASGGPIGQWLQATAPQATAPYVTDWGSQNG